MRIVVLSGIFFIIGLKSGLAQAILMPSPINSAASEWNPVMLPDSSIMLSSNREGGEMNWKCFRFEYRNGEWKSAPAQLDSLINSLIASTAVPSFRFSNDFSRIFVTLYDGDNKRFFESELTDGRWSLFKEILSGNSLDLWHGLSVSDDNLRLYASSKKGVLYSFHRTEGEWGSPEIINAFDNIVSEIQQPIAIGNDGLLFNGKYKSGVKKGKDDSFFFAKLLANGKWSAPSKVDGLFGNDVAITPFKKSFHFFDWMPNKDMAIGLAEVPKFLQNEMRKSERNIVRQTKQEIVTVAETLVKQKGRYFALLIGNSNYNLDKLDLDRPASDVQILFKTLTDYYQFEKENIQQVVNGDRNTILSELYKLRAKINPTDNLLIFYAGHGSYDDQAKQGYWWPIDATEDNPSNWLSNSDLREQIRAISSKHTLLISDACFSGGIFKLRGAEEIRKASLDVQQLYRMQSRRAMTSGTMSTVPDESVFFKYLIKYLIENKEPYISSGELFAAFRKSVLNNSLAVPQDGVIMDTGDEGGDFIFIRK